jgi:hypothetical protein
MLCPLGRRWSAPSDLSLDNRSSWISEGHWDIKAVAYRARWHILSQDCTNQEPNNDTPSTITPEQPHVVWLTAVRGKIFRSSLHRETKQAGPAGDEAYGKTEPKR